MPCLGGGRGGAREASSEGSLAEATPDTDESGAGMCVMEHRHRSKRRHHGHGQASHQHPAAHDIAPKVLFFFNLPALNFIPFLITNLFYDGERRVSQLRYPT